MSTTIAHVSALPKCSFCPQPAEFDGRTTSGQWGFMCNLDYGRHGTGLGTGQGQRLVLGDPDPEPDNDARTRAAHLALAEGDMDAFEEAVGDGDPLDFI